MDSISPGTIVVVTGATGFIGSALVDALVARGTRVHCLTRARPRGAEARGDVEWHVVDWSDARIVERTPALAEAKLVFHLAGRTKGLTLDDFRAGNVRPTESLLAAFVRRGLRPDRFVLVSSQSAAGPAPGLATPRRELDTPAPVDDYGRSKLEAEHVVQAYGNAFPWTIVRPSSVYGPRDRDFLAVFRQVSSGLWVYPATRERWLSIAYVNDVVEGILVAATHPNAVGRTYFLAGEPAVSWRDVYMAAAKATGARKLLEVDLPQSMVDIAGRLGDLAARLTKRVGLVTSTKVALGRPAYWICSTERARDELGFVCRTTLGAGMRDTARWYAARGWLRGVTA
jgi:nucleoside-diphosphate-sugar epimerase